MTSNDLWCVWDWVTQNSQRISSDHVLILLIFVLIFAYLLDMWVSTATSLPCISEIMQEKYIKVNELQIFHDIHRCFRAKRSLWDQKPQKSISMDWTGRTVYLKLSRMDIQGGIPTRNSKITDGDDDSPVFSSRFIIENNTYLDTNENL